MRLFSDADAQVRKRRDSFASTQATQLCRVRRVGWPTHSRLLHGGVILRVRQWDCRYHRERLSPWLAPSYQDILFSYFWKNGDSYIACVLLIVYGHNLCISIYFWFIELRINLQLVSFVNYAISRSISHKWNSISSKGKFNFTFLKINSKYSWNSWVAKLPNSEQLFCYKLYPKILINIIFYSCSFLINNNINIYIYIRIYIYI